MSESVSFTAGKTYTVYEFDKLMREADTEHVKGKTEAISYYGSEDAWYDAAFERPFAYLEEENKRFAEFLGYEKTYFIVNMPDGSSIKERQDIGDGDGGVIDFLEHTRYTKCVEALRDSLKKEAPEYYAKYYENNEEIKSDDLSQSETKEENYVIDATDETERTNKEKLAANISAIKTLKKLESEPETTASKDEKDILAAYSGWGGLSDVFDENKGYKNEREELKELLTEDEYESARRSTLDSFYTSPMLIEAIYEKLSDMGVKDGSLLEPSCGVGNFIGKIPSNMNLNVTGVELDSLSGRIASKLYPEADIHIKGFQKTDFADNSFDVAVGNVPFGETVIRSDSKYKNDGLMIHDYFFVKSLDKLKDGGIAAFITSSGTLDKKNQSARELMSKKANFLGAVRLPDNAFKNSGTTVTTDIIFLQKKDIPDISADKSWLKTDTNETGISMNQYFIDHPEQVIGKMEMESSRFGFKPVCKAPENGSISEMLERALKNINGKISVNRSVPVEEKLAEPDYIIDYASRNFSYVLNEGKVYYKGADEKCYPALKRGKPFSKQDTERVAGMCKLRDIYDRLIDFQSIYDSDESQIESIQKELSTAYNEFTEKFGRINLKENRDVFQDDDKYFNLSALEVYEDDKFVRLSDVFSKRVIDPVPEITYAETSHDALAASLNRKGLIDISYMAELTGKQEEEVIADLINNEMFLNPENMQYESADEYLSGNVRKKLADAERAAADNPDLFSGNVDALRLSQPKDLTAADISVRLGSTWISPEYIKMFINENLGISERELGIGRFANFSWSKPSVSVEYQPLTGEWNISGKHSVHNNIIDDTYGVVSSTGYSKKNALDLLENALNLKTPPKLYKEKEVPDDAKKQQECQIKTDSLQNLFKDWIFKDYDRRTDLEQTYNEMFNNRVERHFDGSGLTFDGMNKNITLKGHQKDAVARQIYGGNTLLAHCVGVGKTFTMAAAAMEMKRIGICKKPMFVVPKAVLLQWQNEFKTLYPASNILTIRPEEFSSAKRKLLTAKIAAGDYDAVIVTHDMFEKIKLTDENRMEYMQQEIDEIMDFIASSDEKGSWSVKRAEKKKEELTEKMEALAENMKDGKDDVLCFENLGIDHLFIDEAHHYKNLSIQTQMSNVAGINTHGAKKSDDMYYKCRYLNDLTDCKGITFATGTPISNSMTELYVNMKYLQPDVLSEMGCKQFDQWAANFGQCVTAMEFDPTGTSMRVKTRFASFFNMPELMTAFSEAADIQTADKLKLPVPEAETIVVGVDPSPYQKGAIESLTQRIDAIGQGKVDPKEDNMLKITTDGRKIAFDQRMFDPDVAENPNGKINNCINIAMEIYEKGKETKTTQIIFSDLGVPQKRKNGEKPKTFDAYNDIKDKLIKSGVPEKEIAIIHDYQTDKSKLVLSEKMRKGDIRFLIGSTEKCGTGLNVQNKLAAIHHLDVPWRPSDIEQREGRIIRQGNENKNVKVYRYVTKGSFDTYSWQIIEQKQRYVSQLMNCDPHLRKIEDVDTAVLSAAQAKSIASGDPRFEEKANLERDVRNLEMEETIYLKSRYNAEKSVNRDIPDKLLRAQQSLQGQLKDKRTASANSFKSPDDFIITIKGKDYTDKKEAGEAIINYAKQNLLQISSHGQSGENIGTYRGFTLNVNYNFAMKMHEVTLVGKFSHTSTGLSESGIGQIQRLDNTLDSIEKNINRIENQISGYEEERIKLLEILEKPFTKKEELEEKKGYLEELTKEIESDLSDKNKDRTSKVEESEEIFNPEIEENVPINEPEESDLKEEFSIDNDVKVENSSDVKEELEDKKTIVTESEFEEENEKAEKLEESNEETHQEEPKEMSQSETKESAIPVSDARKMKFSNFKLSLCNEGDTDTDCKYKFTADTEKNKDLIITVTDNKKDIEQWAKAHGITYKDETKSLRSVIKEKQQLAKQKSEDKKNEKQTTTPIVGAEASHGSNSPMNK